MSLPLCRELQDVTRLPVPDVAERQLLTIRPQLLRAGPVPHPVVDTSAMTPLDSPRTFGASGSSASRPLTAAHSNSLMATQATTPRHRCAFLASRAKTDIASGRFPMLSTYFHVWPAGITNPYALDQPRLAGFKKVLGDARAIGGKRT